LWKNVEIFLPGSCAMRHVENKVETEAAKKWREKSGAKFWTRFPPKSVCGKPL
jgi:hypothetical protein